MTIRSAAYSVRLLVSRLVNDEAGDYHSDGEIQNALDRYRREARYLILDALPTYAEGGTASYLTFTAPNGLMYWESDGVVTDNDYTVLTPTTEDWTNGRWTFSAAQNRPLHITGYYHDPYNAAADLLEVRLAMIAENYDFRTSDGDAYNRSQAREGLEKLIAKYRAAGGPGGQGGIAVSTMMRTDVNIW